MKFAWRPRAVLDFENQIAYLEKRNPSAALRMKQTVEEAVDALRRFPDLGRPSRARDVRELVINGTPYILVYRRMEKQVAILRLFHVAQKR